MRLIFFILTLVMVVILATGCTDKDVTSPLNQSEATPTLDSSSTISPEELVIFVESAYEYAQVHGQEAALKEFNNQSGQFVDGELYIFAYDLEGNTLALPFQPELIGTTRWNNTDTSGAAYIQNFVSTAQSGGGFTQYLYVDPADNFTVKQKISYVMMVDQDWLIGAGLYNSQEDVPIGNTEQIS